MTPAERIDLLEKGQSPFVVARMKSGYAVMGDSQYLPGYCLLLAVPMVGKLNDLEGAHRTAFLEDMASLGDAILQATDAVRINYSIYGNLDHFLHAHVFPRYDDEPAEYRAIPPMSIPADTRGAPEYAFDPAKHGGLRLAIAEHLHPYDPKD
jgi:diadenosine tetraphosphate (Ap4A) HIT family hydrolase